MGMGCPFHCSGDRATSTVPTSKGLLDQEQSTSQSKYADKIQPYSSLPEENPEDAGFDDEHLNLKTLATAVKVLTSPPVSEFSIPLATYSIF